MESFICLIIILILIERILHPGNKKKQPPTRQSNGYF